MLRTTRLEPPKTSVKPAQSSGVSSCPILNSIFIGRQQRQPPRIGNRLKSAPSKFTRCLRRLNYVFVDLIDLAKRLRISRESHSTIVRIEFYPARQLGYLLRRLFRIVWWHGKFFGA